MAYIPLNNRVKGADKANLTCPYASNEVKEDTRPPTERKEAMERREAEMRTFEYRQPRTTANFGLEFCVDRRTVYGLCTDVSDGGIRGVFEEQLNVGDTGSLKLRHPRRSFTLDATVAHIEGDNVGLTFLCLTKEDRLQSELFAQIAHPRHF